MNGGGADGRERRWGGLALALLATGLLVLATFMPKLHCDTIDLRENRLIDGWEGVVLLGCSAMVALGAAVGQFRRWWGWLSCAGGMAALGIVIYASTGSRLIVQTGGIGGEAPVRAVVGIGLLTAGLGGLLAIIAGILVATRGGTGADEVLTPRPG